MKIAQKITWVFAAMAVLGLSLHLLGPEAFAAEKTNNWRPTYDLVMRWVNFGIIVFLYILGFIYAIFMKIAGLFSPSK